MICFISNMIKTRICCCSVVPTPSIPDTPNRKVQRSAARFVTNNFSYHSSVTSMLAYLRWPLLEHKRNYLKLIMFYKILNGLVNASFTLSASTRGHSQHFVIPFARTDTYLNSFQGFFPTFYYKFMELSDSLVDLDDINQFKKDLSLYLLHID